MKATLINNVEDMKQNKIRSILPGSDYHNRTQQTNNIDRVSKKNCDCFPCQYHCWTHFRTVFSHWSMKRTMPSVTSTIRFKAYAKRRAVSICWSMIYLKDWQKSLNINSYANIEIFFMCIRKHGHLRIAWIRYNFANIINLSSRPWTITVIPSFWLNSFKDGWRPLKMYFLI